MGLLGTLLKGIGKVAKAGLSVATHGVSDKVLGVLKSTQAAKPTVAKPFLTTQKAAAIMKLKQMTPQVKTTTVYASARSGAGQAGKYSSAGTTKPKKRAPRKASTGAKRKPPTGGLDLKALSRSWNAAGKPGKWIDWVKSHK